jgi:hypothetical protein
MTTELTETVLDYIDNIVVPGNVFDKPANEYWALTYLRAGMEFLYRQAARCDEQATPKSSLNVFMLGGFLHRAAGIPVELLTCSFHWYAMSAYQYALLVGAIAYRHDDSRPLPDHYVEQAMPEIKAFRDKVAAHFAWAKRSKNDNPAERTASILPTLAFMGDSFHMPGMVVGQGRDGNTSTSDALRPWSVRKTHEALRHRYWPPDSKDEQVQPAEQ